MNAVIALCHFCETHGPCAIFCTQTLRDTKIEDISFDPHYTNKLCFACNSLKKICIYSKDEESETTFLSSQIPINEVSDLVKQASIRSLSCEINCNKDGGFVFFGDSIRGHVLSHSFHVSDLQARGFFQLFSIIIIMKDKYFLLNIKPFLAEHLKKISKEIQNSAQKTKEGEETKGYIRNRRLSSSQLLVQTPRSLIELTGEENIFAILHSHFSWILLAGSRFFSEYINFDNLLWIFETNNLKTNDHTELVSEKSTAIKSRKCENDNEIFCLRYAKRMLGTHLTAVCYCVLIGIKILVRGAQNNTVDLLMCLIGILPEQMQHLVCFDLQTSPMTSNNKIISLLPSVSLPAANNLVMCIDMLDKTSVLVTWNGELPIKFPDLLTKLMKAVDESRFTNLVLSKHTKALVEEWKNKIICIHRTKSNNGLNKLKKVLGIQTHDQPLINYWINYLC